jgi:hypothetical protein
MANKGVYLDAGGLFSAARAASERMHAAPERAGDVCTTDSLIAIVFAAASVEGFLNELAELARSLNNNVANPGFEKVDRFGKLAVDAEESRASAKFKFRLAEAVFESATMSKGTQPYQDLCLLIDLRNALIHLKPSSREGILKQLEGRNLLADELTDNVSWLRRATTRATAEWALKTADSAIEYLARLVPEGSFKVLVNLAYFELPKLRDQSSSSADQGEK